MLLSALFFKSGLSSAVLNYALVTNRLCISDWILDEFTDKLNSPQFRRKNRNHRFDEETIQSLCSFVRKASEVIIPTNPLPTLCRDPDDDHVLQLAQFVQAEFIITGDRDLLILDPVDTCRIVSPRTFAELVGLV